MRASLLSEFILDLSDRDFDDELLADRVAGIADPVDRELAILVLQSVRAELDRVDCSTPERWSDMVLAVGVGHLDWAGRNRATLEVLLFAGRG